jgi:acetolactate synthase I/II/III large subunit
MSSSESQSATVTVGAALAETLARSGVKVAFTVPGETVLGLLESLGQNRIRVVAARHEGAASFMGAAVGQLTGRPALCVATRGPGAANLAIGLHAAQADSVPLIAIVGQVRRELRGREAFQEMDLVSVFQPLVKWVGEVKEAADAVPLLERAIAASIKGRPGPVLLSVPADILDLPATGYISAGHPAPHPEQHAEPDPTLVRKVLHLLTDSRRPLILAGAGVLRARSTDALVRFAQTIRVPVIAAWRRADVFPNDNPLYLGMTGNGAPETVRRRLEETDALLVLGSRLGEITTYGYELPGPSTHWAQVDIEPQTTGSVRPDLIMSADAAAFLRVAQRLLGRAALDAASFEERTIANAADREAFEEASVVDSDEWTGAGVHPGRVVATLSLALPAEAIVATDAGDFGTWAARGLRFRRPGTFLGSSAGPMGYGLPAAIGATLARPGRLGIALAGDGGFAMTMAEIETAVRERAHVIAIVFDNARYGTIYRQQQQRGSGAGIATKLGRVDFAAVAEACGALGITVRSDEEFEPALMQALEAGRPTVLHLLLDPSWTLAGVAPMASAADEDGDAGAGESGEAAPGSLDGAFESVEVGLEETEVIESDVESVEAELAEVEVVETHVESVEVVEVVDVRSTPPPDSADGADGLFDAASDEGPGETATTEAPS